MSSRLTSERARVTAARGAGAPWVVGAAGGLLLVGWTAWFTLARVSVYETSNAARLEVDAASHAIDTPVAGRVVSTSLLLGRLVRAGDLLLELDAEELRLQLAAEKARLATLGPQLEALRRELVQEQSAVRGQGRLAVASLDEARARQRESETLARLKDEERQRYEKLRAAQQVAEMEARRAAVEADTQLAQTEALRGAVARVGNEQQVQQAERRAKAARLELEIARLASDQAAAESKIRVHEQAIRLREIRAPISGRLGEIATLRPGAVVVAGARLAVIVPDGQVRVVGSYVPAAALGRIRPGQPARLRLDGFPWTKYGVVTARVTSVGSESLGGHVRVEMAVVRDPMSRIPLEHGLPGVAEVEVDRVSPAALVLDAAGRYLSSATRSGPDLAAGPAR